MKNELMKLDVPELQVIEKSKAEQIKSTFEPMVKMLSEFEEQFNEVVLESEKEITRETTLKAKRLRIDIGRVRIQTGKLKDEQKSEYLRAGNAIQAVHNILVWAVTDKENKLKEIENYFEEQEKKRLEYLQKTRADMLLAYLPDSYERNLSGMDEDVWNAYFNSKKNEYEDRIKAENKAEKDRIAREKEEAKERERIRIENERLKKEAEKREAEIEKERKQAADKLKDEQAKADAERKQREVKEKADREAHEKALKAEREKAAEAQRQLQAKADAELKAKEAEEIRIQNELAKGDADKVKDLINDLIALKSKYSFKSKRNQKKYSDVRILIDKIVEHINK